MQGGVQLWFDHLALESITGYDMFTDLLIDKWGRNTDNSLECNSSNVCAVDNQYIDNLLSQLDHSSPEMFQIMSVPAIHKNVTEYFEDNVSKPHAETKRDINQIIQGNPSSHGANFGFNPWKGTQQSPSSSIHS